MLGCGTGFVSAPEWLAHVGEVLVLQGWGGIEDCEGGGCQTDGDEGAWGAVADGVAEEVGGGGFPEGGIGFPCDGGGEVRGGEPESCGGGGGRAAFDEAEEDGGQVDGFAADGAGVGFEAVEEGEGSDHGFHFRGDFEDLGEGGRGGFVGPLGGEFGEGAEFGDGGAQFVGDIAGEAPFAQDGGVDAGEEFVQF